jgi:hypothetical protein
MLRLIIGLLVFTFALSAASYAEECGFDDCPTGYHNLFCRKINTSRQWVDTKSPISIKASHWMCMIPEGGPINVTGDLVYFYKLREISEPDRQFVATVRRCNIVIHNVMGAGDVNYGDQNFSFGPYVNAQDENKKAEYYIVHPQLSEAEQQAFRAPFTSAVDVNCDMEYHADEPSQESSAPPCDARCQQFMELYKAIPKDWNKRE